MGNVWSKGLSTAHFWAPLATHMATYTSMDLLLCYLDRIRPAWYVKRQIMTNIPPTQPSRGEVWRNVLRLFAGASAVGYLLRSKMPPRESLQITLKKLLACFLIADAYLYHTHILLHKNKWIHQHIHKVHHQFSQPTALATNYAHPLEQLFVDMGTLLVAPAIVKLSLRTMLCWTVFLTVYTQLQHHGYRLTSSANDLVLYHTLHHTLGTGNYGLTPIWDSIYGTRNT